jgi:hypothetical protein
MTSISPIRPIETPATPETPSSTPPPPPPSVFETDAKTFVSKYLAQYKDQFGFLKNVKMDSSRLALMVVLGAALLFIANGIYTLVALAIAIAVAAWAFGKIMDTPTA